MGITAGVEDWIAGAAKDIEEWTEGAVQDIAEWTRDAAYTIGIGGEFDDVTNWTGGAFEDAYNWAKDGDNWEAAGKTIVGSTITGFVGDWEKGWDMFTNPDLYKGDTYDEMEKNKQKKEAKVGQPVKGSRYNMTSNFNYKLSMKRIDYAVVYGAFGDISDPNHVMMDPRDCEAVDCMNPCYGEN